MSVKILLASGSPRRIELLGSMGFEVRVCPSGADESCDPLWTPERCSRELALRKAWAVAHKAFPDEYVVAADTGVYFDGKLLGKPADKEEARRMLYLLSGKTHKVYTGIAVVKDGKECSAVCETEVGFSELSEELIENYLSTNESMDKAGAYGVQGYGAALVSGIKGDYFNVVGLPLALLFDVFEKEFGIKPLSWLTSAGTEKNS